MAHNVKSRANRLLTQSLQDVLANMRRINQNVSHKPTDIHALITHVGNADDTVSFELGPIVLNIPQKAKAGLPTDFFVVLKGSLILEQEQGTNDFRTVSYATNIGYFQNKKGDLIHTFGAHYDFDRSFAHPLFHVQMSTHAKYSEHITNNYQSINALSSGADRLEGITRNVRFPTAQMDFFAVLLQICSDHLVNVKSQDDTTQLNAYKNLIMSCSKFRSFFQNHPGLQQSSNTNCHRSQHWYEH